MVLPAFSSHLRISWRPKLDPLEIMRHLEAHWWDFNCCCLAFSLGQPSPVTQQFQVRRKNHLSSKPEWNIPKLPGEGEGAPRRRDCAHTRGWHLGFQPSLPSCFETWGANRALPEEKFIRPGAFQAAILLDPEPTASLRPSFV